MKKVFFTIRKSRSDNKLSGVGYLSEGNLLVPALSSKGKPYIRVFEDVTEKCKPISENEFKGYMDVIFTEVPVFKSVDNDSDERKEDSYEILDSITVTYNIWFKHID